jgi:hypothetical protein
MGYSLCIAKWGEQQEQSRRCDESARKVGNAEEHFFEIEGTMNTKHRTKIIGAAVNAYSFATLEDERDTRLD